MVEYDRTAAQREVNGKPGYRTCIVGIGGAGSNVLDRITLDRTVDAHLICMHTDIRVLSHAMAPNKLQLGSELMRGVGAGGDPDLGREAALFSREQIREALTGFDIIFICAGLGGGTGSGAAPVVAEIAKNTNALVMVTATMPFSFEGRRRLAQAEEALEILQKRADALVLFENNRMGELVLPKDGIQKAFSQADQLISQSLRAVSTIVTMPGIVKLGLDDLTSALTASNGRCLFGFGEARGQNRGSEALKRALKSPLIDQGRLLSQTRTLLVHIAGGESLTLVEVEGVMKQLGRHVPDQTHMLFGVAVDTRLGESVAVTLISSLGLAQLNAHANAAPPAEMLQPVSSKAPAPAPATPVADLLPPPPVLAPVQREPEPAMDMLFATEEISVPAAPTELTVSPPARDELFDHQASDPSSEDEAAVDTEDFLSDNEEDDSSTNPFQSEMEEELEPVPAPPPPVSRPSVVLARPRPEPVIESSTSLAAVVAKSNVPAPQLPPVISEEDSPYAPPSQQQPAAVNASANANQVRRSATDEQQAFRFGEEDRGRFKNTEPALVEGEDLDVPTWMRLKRKLKR